MLFQLNVPPEGDPKRTIGDIDVLQAESVDDDKLTLGAALTVTVIESVAKQPLEEE